MSARQEPEVVARWERSGETLWLMLGEQSLGAAYQHTKGDVLARAIRGVTETLERLARSKGSSNRRLIQYAKENLAALVELQARDKEEP